MNSNLYGDKWKRHELSPGKFFLYFYIWYSGQPSKFVNNSKVYGIVNKFEGLARISNIKKILHGTHEDLNANGLPLNKGSVPIFFGTQTLVFGWFASFFHQSMQKPG